MLSAPGVGKEHSLTTWFFSSCPCLVVEGSLARNRVGGKRYFCGRFPRARLDGFGAICCKDADLGAHSVPVSEPRTLCGGAGPSLSLGTRSWVLLLRNGLLIPDIPYQVTQ